VSANILNLRRRKHYCKHYCLQTSTLQGVPKTRPLHLIISRPLKCSKRGLAQFSAFFSKFCANTSVSCVFVKFITRDGTIVAKDNKLSCRYEHHARPFHLSARILIVPEPFCTIFILPRCCFVMIMIVNCTFIKFLMQSGATCQKTTTRFLLLWSPCGIGQTIIFSSCGFFLISFFPCIISAVGDWVSAILPHMVWP